MCTLDLFWKLVPNLKLLNKWCYILEIKNRWYVIHLLILVLVVRCYFRYTRINHMSLGGIIPLAYSRIELPWDPDYQRLKASRRLRCGCNEDAFSRIMCWETFVKISLSTKLFDFKGCWYFLCSESFNRNKFLIDIEFWFFLGEVASYKLFEFKGFCFCVFRILTGIL